MIITKLNGGLGNQLFEYACARNLQLKYGDELYLDIEGFKRSPRHYSLGDFRLSEDVNVLPEKDSRKLILLQAISKYNRKLAYNVGKLFNVYMWKTSEYKKIDVPDTKGRKAYFYGYWQSEEYFHEYGETIKQELKVKTPFLEVSKPYLPAVEAEKSVCVHIRRGDYVNCGFISCDEAYYLNGMEYVKERVPGCNFVIFTDDVEWVKNNIHFKDPVTFVDLADPDYEVLRLMYTCKHFVMSNSSFSWWAQYLSDNKDKVVVAPKVWFPGYENNRSMYLDYWHVM